MAINTLSRDGAFEHDARITINENFSYLQQQLGLAGFLAPITRTATAAGDGVGLIGDGGAVIQWVTVTSANDAHKITLPAPVVGTILLIYVGAGHAYQLQSSSPATVGINTGVGLGAKTEVSEDNLILAFCVSATDWRVMQIYNNSGTVQINGIGAAA